MLAYEFALPGAPSSPGFRFPGQRFTIGSSPDADLRFEARLVKPLHAEVEFDRAGDPWIRDLSNGQLWLNGTLVQHERLTVGCQLRLGRLDLEIRDGEVNAAPLDSTARRPTPFATPPTSKLADGQTALPRTSASARTAA